MWPFTPRKSNTAWTSKETILNQMSEKRMLPVGREEFHEWADRIISGTLLPADPESMKFALANMLMHLGPTVSTCEDSYFIHSLRKFAINQVADTMRREIQDKVKTRLAEEEAKEQKENLIAQVNGTQ